MRLHRLALLVAISALAVIPTTSHAVAGSTAAAASPAAADSPSCTPFTRFEADDFPHHPKIDNPWHPMRPGTRLTYEGQSNTGGGPLPHEVIFTVTSLTKVVNGVRTVVIWDQDLNDNVLAESELAFFAQDDDGNIWTLGEYPEEYDNGKFVGAPSTWISGQSGAKAGIDMLAHPRPGTPAYVQGKALAVEFFDCGQVASKTSKEVVIDEWSPLDPASGHQLKTHAKGIGVVQIAAVNDPEGETLVLTKIEQLSTAQLGRANRAALKLERRAYRINADYRTTQPARWGAVPPKGY